MKKTVAVIGVLILGVAVNGYANDMAKRAKTKIQSHTQTTETTHSPEATDAANTAETMTDDVNVESNAAIHTTKTGAQKLTQRLKKQAKKAHN